MRIHEKYASALEGWQFYTYISLGVIFVLILFAICIVLCKKRDDEESEIDEEHGGIPQGVVAIEAVNMAMKN